MKSESRPGVPHASLPSRTHIEIDDRFSVRDWCMILETTPDELRNAVCKVGSRAEDVRRYLLRGPAC